MSIIKSERVEMNHKEEKNEREAEVMNQGNVNGGTVTLDTQQEVNKTFRTSLGNN